MGDPDRILLQILLQIRSQSAVVVGDIQTAREIEADVGRGVKTGDEAMSRELSLFASTRDTNTRRFARAAAQIPSSSKYLKRWKRGSQTKMVFPS